MITSPRNGWCNFKLRDFQGTPSYLTDVVVDLLNAFINYYTNGYGVAVFDEEGSEFTLLLTYYNSGVFIIEQKDKTILHDFSDTAPDYLAIELLNDIQRDLDGWYNFLPFSDDKEVERYKHEVDKKIDELKKILNVKRGKQ